MEKYTITSSMPENFERNLNNKWYDLQKSVVDFINNKEQLESLQRALSENLEKFQAFCLSISEFYQHDLKPGVMGPYGYMWEIAHKKDANGAFRKVTYPDMNKIAKLIKEEGTTEKVAKTIGAAFSEASKENAKTYSIIHGLDKK